jgi:hypothetical protein
MGKLTELRQRLLFVLGALLVYRIGTFIPVPGVNPEALAVLFDQNQGSILDMFNMFSGGALERASIFALGIMPYISASIIMQLMTAVIPKLEQLKKEGEAGRRKITQYTRYGTVVLATFQAIGISIALQGQTAGGSPIVVSRASVRVHRGGVLGDRDHVPDVARRADHRARHRQRHLADHLRRHRRRPAGRGRRHVGTGAHRRDERVGGAWRCSRWRSA